LSTNKKIIGAHVDPPKIDSAHVFILVLTLIANISGSYQDVDKQ